MSKLFGLYSPEGDLLSVHKTEIGANKNKERIEAQHGEGFYVDYGIIHE